MIEGEIKFWDGSRGYGFLRRDDGGPDVFVHIRTLQMIGLPGKRWSGWMLPKRAKVQNCPQVGIVREAKPERCLGRMPRHDLATGWLQGEPGSFVSIRGRLP
jgi:hypothetical protein